MGLAASPSQALRGGSWAALLSIHFLKAFPDPASPESDLSTPPELPRAGDPASSSKPPHLCSPFLRALGIQEGRFLAPHSPGAQQAQRQPLAQYPRRGSPLL